MNRDNNGDDAIVIIKDQPGENYRWIRNKSSSELQNFRFFFFFFFFLTWEGREGRVKSPVRSEYVNRLVISQKKSWGGKLTVVVEPWDHRKPVVVVSLFCFLGVT